MVIMAVCAAPTPIGTFMTHGLEPSSIVVRFETTTGHSAHGFSFHGRAELRLRLSDKHESSCMREQQARINQAAFPPKDEQVTMKRPRVTTKTEEWER